MTFLSLPLLFLPSTPKATERERAFFPPKGFFRQEKGEEVKGKVVSGGEKERKKDLFFLVPLLSSSYLVQES